MKFIDITRQIPAEYRKEILETNIILSATPSKGNPSMIYLATIWRNFVEPDLKMDCNLCMDRVLKNWRGMQSTLIDLEKDAKLLEGL